MFSSPQFSDSSQHNESHTTSPTASTESEPSNTSIVPSPESPLTVPSPEPAPPSRHSMTTRARGGIFKPKTFSITINPFDLVIPKSYIAALLIKVWKRAMLEEFLALLRNKTWTLVLLPPGKNLVGCTWIFKLKKDADVAIERHKACLVAQGFSQEPGFDFDETFSPVVKANTIRLILAIAGWSITHLDVNNAFLHDDLVEDIYMKQHPASSRLSPARLQTEQGNIRSQASLSILVSHSQISAS